MITITDAVDLIIEKKVKDIEEQILLKEEEIKTLEEKHFKEESKNIEKILSENFDIDSLSLLFSLLSRESFFFSRRRSKGLEMGEISIAPMFSHGFSKISLKEAAEVFVDFGCMSKDSLGKSKKEEINKIRDEIDDLRDLRRKTKEAKEQMVLEITMQQLTSIDVNFAEKLDELVNRIFEGNNIKQLK